MEEAIYQTIYQAEWQSLMGRIPHRFARRESCQQAQGYMQGLMSDVHRRNSWQLAEAIGEKTPDGIQQLLNTARWDEKMDCVMTSSATRLTCWVQVSASSRWMRPGF